MNGQPEVSELRRQADILTSPNYADLGNQVGPLSLPSPGNG